MKGKAMLRPNVLQNIPVAFYIQTSETTNEFAWKKTWHHVRGNNTDNPTMCHRMKWLWEEKKMENSWEWTLQWDRVLYQNRKAVCLNIGQSIFCGASTWQYDIHSFIRSMNPVSVDVVGSGRTRTTHRKVLHGRISTTGGETWMCGGRL